MKREQKKINEINMCFLALLKAGLQFNMSQNFAFQNTDWEQLIEQARFQTVLPIIYDEIMLLPADKKPPKEILSILKSITICTIANNEHLLSVQDELLATLQAKSIPCVILKGTSAAVNYPKPELRVQGDIDIMVDEINIEKTSIIMENAGFRYSKKEHAFHKSFFKDDVCVELHHSFSTVPKNIAGNYINTLMQTAIPHTYNTIFENHTFPVLSCEHQALSLLLHMQRHMISNGLGIRQLCDWAMFINKVDPKHWQEKLLDMLDRCGLLRFAAILTKTCVLHLGLPSELCPWCLHISDDLCFELICDFLSSGNFGRKDTVRAVSSIFISDHETDTKKPALVTIIKKMNKSAIRHFPITKKIPVFLPVMWFFLSVRYMARMAFGLRPKHSLKKILKSANQRKLLYASFHLFETGHKLHS